jgi:hypothetical protein
MEKYKWAANPAKLLRAQRILGPMATELQLLAEYRKYAGYVLEEYLPEEPVVEAVIEQPIKMPEVGETVVIGTVAPVCTENLANEQIEANNDVLEVAPAKKMGRPKKVA